MIVIILLNRFGFCEVTMETIVGLMIGEQLGKSSLNNTAWTYLDYFM